MKLNILTTAALLAMTGAVMTQSAKAQFVSSNSQGAANAGDLILSFVNNASGSPQGGLTNYEVDLGAATNFIGASQTINIVNIASDLNTIYGSNWATNSNLQFSLLGAAQNGLVDTVYASNTSTAYASEGRNVAGSHVSDIGAFYNPGADATTTDGAATGSFIVKTGSPDSFNNLYSNDGSAFQTLETSFATNDPTLALNVLQTTGRTSGTSTLEPGSFEIVTSGANAGEVEFVVASAPEPSTYALMMLGGAFLFWHFRRKSVSSL